jgi:signal transduction histidine kinase
MVRLLCASFCSFAGTSWGMISAGERGPFLALDLAIGLLGVAATPLLARRPLSVGVVLIAVAAVLPMSLGPACVAVVEIARRYSFPIAVGAGLANVAALAVRAILNPIAGLSFAWWLIIVTSANAAIVGWVALVKARSALIASLEERALRAEAEQGRRVAEARAAERAAMAREMHDVLAHRLSLAATYAGALEYRPDVSPERLSSAAGVIRTTVHQALDELREVIAVLREDADGTDRPVPAFGDLPELVEESRSVGTPVRLHEELTDPVTLPPVAGRTAYRVVQEALTNARKHAPGQPVDIALDGTPGGSLVIDVRNPLCANGSAIPGSGTGLVGLTERVRLAGGSLDHRLMPEEFRLRASLPWPV